MKTYAVGTHEKRLTEALLMSTHNIFFDEIENIHECCEYSLEAPC